MVTVGFEKVLYPVEEQSMSAVVTVVVLDGKLGRNVEIIVMSTDGTAQSKSLKYPLSYVGHSL